MPGLLLVLMTWAPALASGGSAASCPVVSPPVQGARPERAPNWMRPHGGGVLGSDGEGLFAYPAREGARARRVPAEDTWPHWAWVPDGKGGLVNLHTGEGLDLPSGRVRLDAGPEGRIPDVDRIDGGSGATAWSGWERDQLWVWRDGEVVRLPWPDPEERVDAYAPSSSGGAWLGFGEEVAEVDPAGAVIRRFDAAPIGVEAVAPAPDDSVLYVLGYGGMLLAWDLEAEAVRWSWPVAGHHMALSPSGHAVASWRWSTTMVVSTETGCLVAALPSFGGVTWVDAKTLAWVDGEGVLHLTVVPK